MLDWLAVRRPVIEPQVEPSDCGYVCVSALLALHGVKRSVADIKEQGGRTSRGLTLRQLRDVLVACGLDTDAVFYDRQRIETFPSPGVILLSRGHYVVVARRRGEKFEVFDPGVGWVWMKHRRLARAANGFGLQIRGQNSALQRASSNKEKTSLFDFSLLRRTLGGIGLASLAAFAVAQIITLTLPLLSARSVDAVTQEANLGFASTVALGFALVSATSMVMNFLGQAISLRLSRRAARGLARELYDRLAGMPYEWFEINRPSAIQNKINSAETQLLFAAEFARSIGGVAMSLIVGLIALLYISPWLAVPGFCSLLLSIAIDLVYNRMQRERFAASLEASQRKQAMTLDLLSQMPLLARFGALRQARTRYSVVVSQLAGIEAGTEMQRNWRNIVSSAVKALETLVFVSLAAAFMSEGNYGLGAFVALGAYKDLLAQSIASLFQLEQRHRMLEIHRLHLRDVAKTEPRDYSSQRAIVTPSASLRNVSYRYGSLDALVLDGIDLEVAPGECLVIRGPSGAGKSTLARLLAGVATPTSGKVLIDGEPPVHPMQGFASVLQGDRLITGSIRENITLYRASATDADIEEALREAEIHDWVMSLPMRLNTMVTDNLAGISGGQKQRLLIARAVLGRPRLVLIDEATASLEVEMERRILSNLRQSGATLIIIAHRPEVWAIADRVVTLAATGIIEESDAGRDRCLRPGA